MIFRLVWRSLLRRPGRSLLLLGGYALGVGVTVALLSIGSALVEQARDRELVGGGELAVVPAGIDLETIKTGGVSSLYFTVEQAPFLYRQVLAGPRFGDRIEAAAPWIDDELVHLEVGGRTHPASAGGRVPSLARTMGVPAEIVAGGWDDAAVDRDWSAPGDSALYADMDRFHLPSGGAAGDSTWAEWHFFAVRLPGDAVADGGAETSGVDADGGGGADGRGGAGGGAAGGWLHLTYMVAGAVPDGRWGGRVLATLVTGTAPDADGADGGGPPASGARGASCDGTSSRGAPGRPPPSTSARTRAIRVPADEVAFSLAGPDLEIGRASVALDSAGTYRLVARLPPPDGGADAAPSAGDEGGREGPDGAAGSDADPGEGTLHVELEVRAASRRHLPPLDVSSGDYPSGYTAPILDGRARGRVCVGDACRRLERAPAYHDHNWGVWRDVTWDWGQARAGPYSTLWGGVRREPAPDRGSRGRGEREGPGRRFLFLADTLGFLGLFPVDSLGYRRAAADGEPPDGEGPRPRRLGLRASRPPDTVRIDGAVRHVRTSRGARTDALFHQMEGEVELRGRLRGRELRATGRGFFETWGGPVCGTHLEAPSSRTLRPEPREAGRVRATASKSVRTPR